MRSIEDILDSDGIGVMSTIRQDKHKPHARYMTFMRKGLKLYTATSKNTHKIADIQSNSNTHILLGYEGGGFGDEYVEYEGQIKLTDSEQLKKDLWNPAMENWFTGINDPNYIVLEISPDSISLMNKKGKEPKILDL
jgi:general stress protein 26